MNNFLAKVLKEKQKEVEIAKAIELRESITERLSISSKPRPFGEALKRRGRISLIAEIKFRSPSRGAFGCRLSPADLAKRYEACGAAAISVLTDREFFGGDILHLSAVKEVTTLPVLRKDFIIDEYQVYESKAFGADAILLIARILSERQLQRLFSLSTALGIETMIEVHSESDIKKALRCQPRVIGINNRNLQSFFVDLKVTERLIKKLPRDIIKVSESGIRSHKDALYLKKLGVDAVLIGEVFMKSRDLKKKIAQIMEDEL